MRLAAVLALAASTLTPVAYHPSNIAYYNTPYFANALFAGGEWFSFSGTEFGTSIDFNTNQFANGYPKFLNPGQKLRAPLFGLHAGNADRPATWPHRDALAKGRIVVTWKGNADVRLASCALSEGSATGAVLDGRRVYQCSDALQTVEVHAIVTPITEIRVWLDGTEGQLFHPLLLERLADADWAFIRFMDWGATNASPQRDWSDRRLPAHAFMNGIINARQPSASSEGNRETGVAFEHMVALANASGRDLWINVPHLATDDFITRLAKLIRFGSDGVNPYDAPQANPLFAPLRSDLRVYVEYSNEIWSSGFSFPQGNWAEEQAASLGLTKPQFTARRFCDTWRLFQDVFGDPARLVRVAAIFTALDAYSRPFLQELAAYGPTLRPQVQPDVLAVTTYFGNGIQDYVAERGFANGKGANDPYWRSGKFANDREDAFDEWTRRILAGDSAQGSGPDATSLGGGFAASLRTLPNETLGYALPIVAYEGGPSLYTDAYDESVTTFIEAMNRDARIADVYRIHLELAKSKGLRTHTPYTDTSTWSRFGQWGHLESLDQPPSASPKYALLLEHFATFSALRSIDEPVGNAPAFTSDASMPAGVAGQAYAFDATTTGGNVTVVGAYLDEGLQATGGDALRVRGTPSGSRKNYILARVTDSDGDPAWRVFTLQTFGGPGTLVQSDFRGASPALHLPWTQTFVLAPNVTSGGWTAGPGILPASGDNALVFSVSAPSAGNESLQQAIADQEFLQITIAAPTLANAEVRFATRRIGFHAPLGYALQANGVTIYTSTMTGKDNTGEIEHVATLPQNTASPVTLRIYAFGAQFDGHATSLTSFQLTKPVERRRAVRR